MFLMKRFRGKLQNDKGFLITLALTIAYVILLTFYSILKHYSFKTYAHDLGIYSQALNTFLKGDFFYETPDLIHNPSGSFFGVHFSPILFMIVPLYAIYPHPETLFFIQSLFLGLAAIVLYLLSRHLRLSQRLSLMVVTSYLLHPYTHAVNLYDFHVHALAPFLLLMTFFFMEKKNFIKACISLMLASSVIEAVPIIAAFSVIGFILREKRQRSRVNKSLFGLLIIPVAFFILGVHVMDIFAPCPLKSFSIPFLMKSMGSTSPHELMNFLLSKRIFESILYDIPLKIAYWIVAFAFVLFIPMFSVLDLFGLIPWLIYTLTTLNRNLYLPGFQYGALFLAPLYYATVRALAEYKRKRNRIISFCLNNHVKVISLLVVLSLLIGPFSPVINAAYGSAYVKPHIDEHSNFLMEEIISAIPMNGSLLVQSDIFPHVCNRRDVYIWVPKDVVPEWILLDFKLEGIKVPIWNTTIIRQVQRLLLKEKYRVFLMKNGVVIWRKEKSKNLAATIFSEDEYVIDFKRLSLVKVTLQSNNSNILLVSKPNVSIGETLWYGPYIALPPGRYVIDISFARINGCIRLLLLATLPDKSNKLLRSYQLCGNNSPREWLLSLEIPMPVEDFEVVAISSINFTYCSLEQLRLYLVSPPYE